MNLAQEMRQLTDKAINISKEEKYQRFLIEKKTHIAFAMSLIKLQASEGKYSIELTFDIHEQSIWLDHFIKNGFDFEAEPVKVDYPSVTIRIRWHNAV